MSWMAAFVLRTQPRDVAMTLRGENRTQPDSSGVSPIGANISVVHWVLCVLVTGQQRDVGLVEGRVCALFGAQTLIFPVMAA